MAATVVGLALLGVADNAYTTHVTGVYLDLCHAGQYGAGAGPDHAHACYPFGLLWMYCCAGMGAALFVLGFALLCLQSISRLRTASGTELGVRGLLHLLAAPVLAYAAFVLLLRGVSQSVWRAGCWDCPTPQPLTAPDPYPVFDVAMVALILGGLLSLSIALGALGGAITRAARRRGPSGARRPSGSAGQPRS